MDTGKELAELIAEVELAIPEGYKRRHKGFVLRFVPPSALGTVVAKFCKAWGNPAVESNNDVVLSWTRPDAQVVVGLPNQEAFVLISYRKPN